MRKQYPLLSLSLLCLASPALAHPGHESMSFMSGLIHPFGGLDHVLAMLAVGLYAMSQAQRRRWLLPVGFVLAMLLGAVLGASGFGLPMVETGIATSVLVLGLLIALVVRLPLALSVPLVAVFALFHGHAHQAEMGDSAVMTYALGFALATALLHAAGWAIGQWLPVTGWALEAKRAAGGLIALAGAVMLGT